MTLTLSMMFKVRLYIEFSILETEEANNFTFKYDIDLGHDIRRHFKVNLGRVTSINRSYDS